MTGLPAVGRDRALARLGSGGAVWSRTRLVRVAAVAVLVALASTAALAYAASHAGGHDMDYYWNAALRLREGAPLYIAGDPTYGDIYRYSSWFAYAWIPMTYLPQEAVRAGWTVVLVAASLASVLPLVSRGVAGACAIALLLPFQLDGAAFGNVQPLLVLMLVWGADRRSGPLWIALGASLKAVPIVLVLVYLGRREYRRAAWTTGLTALIVGPSLLHDLSSYSTEPGPGQMSLLPGSPLLFAAVAAAAAAATLWLARTRYGWLAGSVAMVASLPRLLTYEFSFLLVALASSPWARRAADEEVTQV